MKKFLTLTIIAIIALIGLSVSVNAAEVSDEATLKAALAGTDATITLTSNITLATPIDVERAVTIDLNGHSITPAAGFDTANYDYIIAVHRLGDLTIKDSASNGKVSNAGMKLVIVKMTILGEGENGDAAKFTLESGILEDTFTGVEGYAVISGNGNRHNTVITINGGTVKSNSSHAIYHPQDGKVTINGGKIEGITGIEMRSGTLQVIDGTIIGTGVPASSTANGSGSTTIGAGIAIAQHTTERNISVVVEGGNVKGYSAVYESNPQSNATMEKVSIEISGGNFEAINNGTVAVYSQDKTGFITGGTFNSNVDVYVSGETTWTYDGENWVAFVPIQLDKPANAKWNGTKATWDAVPNAEGYCIYLTNGDWYLDIGYVDETSVDLAKYLTDKNGEYVFTVWAEGNGNPYYYSEDVESEAYVFPVEDDKEESTTGGQGTEQQKPEDDKKDEPKEEDKKGEKDETPKTGSVDVVLFASAIVAVISVAGIVTVKKYAR